MYNLEDALQRESERENKNSFYDVFEKHSDEEIIAYKKMAGIPVTDSTVTYNRKVTTKP